MDFIDRLLQSRRIATKVLLFVVPLVLLIAGVGLVGYDSAATLNGHMTVTRATIETIGDFENLQAAVQTFIAEPDAANRAALHASIERQSAGVESLARLLISEAERKRMESAAQLAATITAGADMLWSIREKQASTMTEIGAAIVGIGALATGVNTQVGTLRATYESKERFAKTALFDAYAFKKIAQRIQDMRATLQAAKDDAAAVAAMTGAATVLKQEFRTVAALLSNSGLGQMAPVQSAVDGLIVALTGPLQTQDKALAARVAANDFAKIETDLYASAMAKASDAASRFVELEEEVGTLRGVLDLIGNALETIDALRLHLERFLAQTNEDARQAVIADINALRASGGELAELAPQNPALRDFGPGLEPLLKSLTATTATAMTVAQDWKAAKLAAAETLATGMTGLKDFVAQTQEIGKQDSERSARFSLLAMIAGTLLAVAGGVMLIETLRHPLRRVTEVMTRLAAGDLEVRVEGRDRRDEIGDMVRSVTVFRDAALENLRLERDRAHIARAQREALGQLAEVLGRLAEGDLECRMEAALAEDFIDMVHTYNQAVEALRITLADVRATADDIGTGTGNLATSSDALAYRTEQQAAALAESSRVLHHLTEIVRATAESAKQTSASVNETEEFALRSGEVVARAIDAMGDISRSSEQIATIIGVIDEIAFQTNLLALNADVEAARVGATGRGFAVIAQEVRKLAQRCADAAREIKGLITASSLQVGNGVHLVQQTGAALTEIITHITGVRELVTQISAATGEQATRIGEVTQAVQEVERITQRNAIMVEENNTEIHGVRKRVEILAEKIDRFKTGERQAVTCPRKTPPV